MQMQNIYLQRQRKRKKAAEIKEEEEACKGKITKLWKIQRRLIDGQRERERQTDKDDK
jgi:hypothetical protein